MKLVKKFPLIVIYFPLYSRVKKIDNSIILLIIRFLKKMEHNCSKILELLYFNGK